MNASTSPEFGAHELLVMHEALMTKAANAEMLSYLSEQVQDRQLRTMLADQARTAANHYTQGVNLLQGQGRMSGGMMSAPGMMSGQHAMSQNGEPKLGLRQPSMPAPSMSGNSLSERSICTTVLNLHKHGAIGWMTFAMECADPDLRSYLVNGALLCDRAAYDTWMYMNQKGYYQVPTLLQKTTNTLIHSYQTTPTPQTGYAPMNAMNNLQQATMSSMDGNASNANHARGAGALNQTQQINPNDSNHFEPRSYNMH
ncbi:spore coat protein [Alicyclobacillus cycloheptanicus]|uniref:Spore coat protein CotF n=1 Tax=Alicyclobacillus cycloheptanicus TaxID=1457 RepID=A0ABT9XK56_9BACL|nr:spore coat protein [Alicyclobacillus cycloheptanicus]MDQ0190694.1 spore coat protein CotF [Alicyclobacillus cycloheptanicus]